MLPWMNDRSIPYQRGSWTKPWCNPASADASSAQLAQSHAASGTVDRAPNLSGMCSVIGVHTTLTGAQNHHEWTSTKEHLMSDESSRFRMRHKAHGIPSIDREKAELHIVHKFLSACVGPGLQP